MMHRQAQRPVDSAPHHRRGQGSAGHVALLEHAPGSVAQRQAPPSCRSVAGSSHRFGRAASGWAQPADQCRQSEDAPDGPPHYGAPGRDCAGFVRSCAVSGSPRSGAGGVVPLRRTGALVGALRGAGGSNRSSCTGVGGHGRRLRAGRRVGANGRAPRRVSLRPPTTIRTTARAISQATTISTSGKSATLGGLGRLRGGAWPLVRRQFAAQARKRSLHAVLDSVAGDHAGGAVVALRRGSCSAVGSGVRLSGMV